MSTVITLVIECTCRECGGQAVLTDGLCEGCEHDLSVDDPMECRCERCYEGAVMRAESLEDR
jgi:predicted amidophosphoribosyltransferase